MNTSRDIEKLFEHFGGNAGDYQEIGKENEARSARTRWPLLATLDFTQPPIPEVAQRRDVQLPTARTTRTDEADDATPTPINRGKPPLFARAHRRTIPPIPNVALPPVAPRFAETTDAAPEAAAETTPVTATAPASAPLPPAAPPAAPHAFAPRQTEAPLRGTLPRMPAAPTPPVVAKAASIPMTNRASASPSILGKLFTAAAAETAPQSKTPVTESKSLSSVFDRLRSTSASQEAPHDDNPALARAWATSRTTRS